MSAAATRLNFSGFGGDLEDEYADKDMSYIYSYLYLFYVATNRARQLLIAYCWFLLATRRGQKTEDI